MSTAARLLAIAAVLALGAFLEDAPTPDRTTPTITTNAGGTPR